MSQSILKAAAGVAALAAIAFGASAIAGASRSGSSGSGAPGGGPLAGGRMPQGGPPPGAPGFGRPVTSATAAKVKAAALAKYPGQLERVAALPGGAYIAHVFTSGGSEVHVLVNSRFEVTGLASRPPGAPGGGAPPRPGSNS